jgi:hypothetical protein
MTTRMRSQDARQGTADNPNTPRKRGMIPPGRTACLVSRGDASVVAGKSPSWLGLAKGLRRQKGRGWYQVRDNRPSLAYSRQHSRGPHGNLNRPRSRVKRAESARIPTYESWDLQIASCNQIELCSRHNTQSGGFDIGETTLRR